MALDALCCVLSTSANPANTGRAAALPVLAGLADVERTQHRASNAIRALCYFIQKYYFLTTFK